VVKLYLSTTEAQAHRILNEGFRTLHNVSGFEGVLLADQPLDENSGRLGDEHLVVDIADAVVDEYEIVADEPMPNGSRHSGLGYREWIVPAPVLNEHGQVRLLTAD